MASKVKRARASKIGSPNAGGWKTCSRGHKYRGPGPCPICWPGGAKRARTTGTTKRPR